MHVLQQNDQSLALAIIQYRFHLSEVPQRRRSDAQGGGRSRLAPPPLNSPLLHCTKEILTMQVLRRRYRLVTLLLLVWLCDLDPDLYVLACIARHEIYLFFINCEYPIGTVVDVLHTVAGKQMLFEKSRLLRLDKTAKRCFWLIDIVLLKICFHVDICSYTVITIWQGDAVSMVLLAGRRWLGLPVR